MAIILVVLGHSCGTLIERTAIGAFHMPLFFFISGLFLFHKMESISVFFKKHVKSLLVPLITFGSVLSTYSIILSYVQGNPLPILAKYAGILVNSRHGDFGGSLWFFPSLFLVEMILCLIHKITPSHKSMLLVSFVCAVSGVLINLYYGQGLPWSLDISLLCVVFTAMGYLLRDWIWQKHQLMTYIISLVFFMLSTFFNYVYSGASVDMFCCRIGEPVLFYLSAITGIYCMIGLSKILKCNVDIIRFYGQNSLIVYALHIPFLLVVNLSLRWVTSGWIAGFMQTVIILLIQIPLINLVNTKFRWMTGKF